MKGQISICDLIRSLEPDRSLNLCRPLAIQRCSYGPERVPRPCMTGHYTLLPGKSNASLLSFVKGNILRSAPQEQELTTDDEPTEYTIS